MTIKVSIITATWNCASTIENCLLSVASQTYVNREHIVVDGKSVDGTLDILMAHRDKLALLVSEKDYGIYDALNKGVSRCSGDIIGFMHADDLYASDEVLEQVVNAFNDQSVGAVYGDLVYVHKHDIQKVVRHWAAAPFSLHKLRWGWMPPHPTLYVRREWYERIGGFDLTYRISADYDYILRLFSVPDFKATYIPSVLVKMRTGGVSNRSLANIIKKSTEDLRALRMHKVGGFLTLICKNLSKVNQFIG